MHGLEGAPFVVGMANVAAAALATAALATAAEAPARPTGARALRAAASRQTTAHIHPEPKKACAGGAATFNCAGAVRRTGGGGAEQRVRRI